MTISAAHDVVFLDTATRSSRIAAHMSSILTELGEDTAREGLRDTPRRYAAAMRFLPCDTVLRQEFLMALARGRER